MFSVCFFVRRKLFTKDTNRYKIYQTWLTSSFLKDSSKLFSRTLSYVVAGREHLKQLFAAPEEDLSIAHSVGDRMQIRYTFDESITLNQYHVAVVRAQFTRHIPDMMSDIVEELGLALDDEIPLTDGTQLFIRLT